MYLPRKSATLYGDDDEVLAGGLGETFCEENTVAIDEAISVNACVSGDWQSCLAYLLP